MALWLVRAGAHGEFEDAFITKGQICLTWDGAAQAQSLGHLNDAESIRRAIRSFYPGWADGKYVQHAGQWRAFLHSMQPGDLVAMPRKRQKSIAIGEVVGGYEFDAAASEPFRHTRKVRWIDVERPKVAFDPDLLNSFSAMSTICQIKRNDAEQRVRALLKIGSMPAASARSAANQSSKPSADEEDDRDIEVDPGQIARNQIRTHISRKFVNHDFARLIDSILRAQGYVTAIGPVGADRGVDILAGSGPLGFGEPRLCVQVKSGDVVVDRPTLSELVGVKARFKATYGLLVSWGGFKKTVEDERLSEFFHVRMWDAEDVIDLVLEHYPRLDEDIRERLPLTHIWVLDPTLLDV